MKKWNFYTTNEIKPTGWLYRQLKLQAEGLSGIPWQIIVPYKWK